MSIFLNILFLIVGFVLLVKGADYFVDGACSIAERFGIPQMVIGLTIVAMGTSLPEAAVSISAAVAGKNGIAIGNILGSNIANIALVLGICAVITPLTIQKNSLHYEMPFMIAITAIFVLCGALDSKVGRIDGGLLLLLFALFFAYLIYTTLADNKKKKKLNLGDGAMYQQTNDGCTCVVEEVVVDKSKATLIFAIVKILLGGAAVVAGGSFVVETSTALATMAKIPESLIGLTIVAIGTSLPELVTSVIAAKKGKIDLAIGNVIGSNIFNILLVLGVSSLINPIIFDPKFLIDSMVAIGIAVLLFALIVSNKKKNLGRISGVILLSSYLAYTLYLVLSTLIDMGMI